MRGCLDPSHWWYPESASIGRGFLEHTLGLGPESATIMRQFLVTRWQTFGPHPGWFQGLYIISTFEPLTG